MKKVQTWLFKPFNKIGDTRFDVICLIALLPFLGAAVWIVLYVNQV